MRVYEIFRSIDGEVNACHQGRISTFVRFAGCNLKCSYCFGGIPGEIEPKVVTRSGRYKPLREIKVGEKLVTLHPYERRPVLTSVKKVSVRSYVNPLKFSAGVFKFNVTPEHKVFTQRGLVPVEELNGDKLVYVAHEVWRRKQKSFETCYLPVQVKESNHGERVSVFNLQCEPYPTYLLNGIWVHNCDISEAQEISEGSEMSVDDVLEKVKSLECRKVTLTGGEPLMQKEFFELTKRLAVEGFEVTVETNGTLPLVGIGVKSWVVDFKLPSSGEFEKVRRNIFFQLRECDFVKFVIWDRRDFEFAVKEMRALVSGGCKALFAFSPVFGELPPKTLYEWLEEYKLYDRVIVNLQLHKLIGVS